MIKDKDRKIDDLLHFLKKGYPEDSFSAEIEITRRIRTGENAILENAELKSTMEFMKAKYEQGKKDKETLSQIKLSMIKSIDYNDLGIMVTAILAERSEK
jgi:hypothetical protein